MRILLSFALLVVAACNGKPSTQTASSSSAEASSGLSPSVAAAEDPFRSRTLLASVRNELVAEVVFEDNSLVRVDYKTQDKALRDQFEARLDTVIQDAKRTGLRIKFHAPSPEDPGHDSLYGAQPKPGELHFTRAMFEHLGDKTISVRLK